MSAPKPYPDADVEKIAEAMYEADEGSTPGGWSWPWADTYKDIRKAYVFRARTALDALAEAGRLLPDGLRPFVALDPAMRSGQPNINQTRLPVEAVAGMVWACGVEEAMKDWDLRREDVLVACWYAGTYGLPGPRSRHAQPEWRRRWGVWAKGESGLLWQQRWAEVDDPPMEGDSDG